MDKIPDNLKEIMDYDKDDDYYYRIPKQKLLNKNKFDELCYIIKSMTGEDLIFSGWEYISYKEYVSYQDCICSQSNCKLIFFKKHIKSGLTFKIGSECVTKFSIAEDHEIEIEIEKSNNFKKEYLKLKCLREYCNNKVPNKRSKFSKEGFCSNECKNNFPYCYCPEKKRCIERTSNQNNKNYGKIFFKCANSTKNEDDSWNNGCGFFEWLLEE